MVENSVTLDDRLGVALPLAPWQRELLLHNDATLLSACRKRQRFGLGLPHSTDRRRVYQSDRFIPSRRAMDMEYCQFVMETENEYPPVPSSPPPPSSPSSPNTTYPTNELDCHVRYKETLAANLLYASPPRHKTKLLRFHDNTSSISAASSSPLLLGPHSPSPSSLRSRHIPSSPTRILDAPELRDDYYLNLVSWGDNNILAVALDKVVYLYHTESGAIQEIKACVAAGDYVTSVAWLRSSTSSSGGDGGGGGAIDRHVLAVATFKAELQIWDTATCTKLQSLRGHSDRIGSLAWAGGCLTSGSRDARILHHDLRQACATTAVLLGHQQEICGLAWSPDGRTLASGGNDNLLCLWDAKKLTSGPRQQLAHHRAAVKALAWCPWERHVLASGGGTADRTIKFWHTGADRLLHSVHTGSQVCGLVWSKTERELLSSHGFSQHELCLWKYPTMAKLREFTGHTARVLHLALSPDGASVVSAAADETLRFWNVFGSSVRDTSTPSRLLTTSPCRRNLFPDAVIR